MLVSRMITRLIAYRPIYCFATASSSALMSKTFATKSLKEFTQLLQENKAEFSGELFGSISRHVNSLINAKDRISFDEVNQVLKALEKIDIPTLSLKNVINVLSLLRNIKIRGYSSIVAVSVRNALVNRYSSLQKEREPTEQDLGDMVNAYSELTFFRLGEEQRALADRLLKLLQAGFAKGRCGLTDSQLSYMVYSLSNRYELNQTEFRIRSLLLRDVARHLDTFKIQDLVKVAVNFNRMELFDLETHEFSLLKQIADRILANVSELDERTIYELIRGENVGRMPGFMKLYQEINRNLFNEINDKGQCELAYDSVFRVLGYLADKLPLSRSTETDKKKFFAMLDKFLSYCAEEETRKKQVGYKIKQLIVNNYFAGEQKRTLVKLLEKHSVALHTTILYELAIRNYDLQGFAKDILANSVENTFGEYLYKLGIVAHKLSKNLTNNETTEYFQAIERQIAKDLDAPEKFIEVYKKLNRMDIKLSDFHNAFGEVIQKLPNPLQAPVSNPEYRRIYLQYMHEVLRIRDYYQFFTKYQQAISLLEVSELIRHHIYVNPRKLQWRRQVIQLLSRRVYHFIDSKDKKVVQALIQFLNKYNRFAVGNQLDQSCLNNIFRIIHCLVARMDTLIELDLANSLFFALNKYLSRNFKSYNVESHYRSLVRHLLSFLPKINAEKNRLASTVIRQALRLNVLNKKSLEDIPLDKLSLNFFERARALYIKDSKHIPHVDKVTFGSLEVILSNHNLENMVVENEARILEIVKNVTATNLCFYLTIFNHSTSNPATRRVIFELLNTLIKKINIMERLDIIGVFQNAVNRSYFHFSQYKLLCEKVIETYKADIGKYQLENHLELIKFIITQPNLNPRDYYNELVAYAEKHESFIDNNMELLLQRLASTNYQFRPEDLTYVDKSIKKNPHHGIFFFLMVEQLLSAEAASKAVTDFVEKFNQNQKKKEQNLNKIFYLYLKKKYPQETAALNLQDKALYHDNYLFKPRNPEVYNTIIKLSGGKSQEITELGNENFAFKINDIAFGFLISKRLGAYYEHEFLKRALPILHSEKLTSTILIYYSNTSPAINIQYIHKLCPNLFNEAEYQKVITEYKANSTKGKKTEPEVEI